jgi:disulfide bond formation protein DsbB
MDGGVSQSKSNRSIKNFSGFPLLVFLFSAWRSILSHSLDRTTKITASMASFVTPEYDAMTSNVPFVALMQQQCSSWTALAHEFKPWNALLATSIAVVWVVVVQRGRRASVVSKKTVAAATTVTR